MVATITASATLIGTLGGALVTQRYTLRGKRIDAETASRERAEQRREDARTAAADRMRSTYVELNSRAHYFRSAARRYVAEHAHGRPADSAKLDAAWENYRESYALAQMILSERALTIASAVSRCMDDARDAVVDTDGRAEDLAHLDGYLYTSLGSAVRMLRHALRADLGTEPADLVPVEDRVAEIERLRYRRIGQDAESPAPE